MKPISIFSGNVSTVLFYVRSKIMMSCSYHSMRRCVYNGSFGEAVLFHFHDLLVAVTRMLPFEKILRMCVISYGDDVLVRWVCRHLEAILCSSSLSSVFDILQSCNSPDFAESVVVFIEKRVNTYIKIYGVFEILKEYYKEKDPEIFNSVREECMHARHAYLRTGAELQMRIMQMFDKNRPNFCRHLRSVEYLSINGIYSEMKNEYLFDYANRVMEKMEDINYKNMSQENMETLRMFCSLRTHWKDLLSSEVLVDDTLPCSYLFENIDKFDISSREDIMVANEIVQAYANKRDNFISYIIEESPEYSLMYHQSNEDVGIQMQKLPDEIIKRKVNALARYCNREEPYVVAVYKRIPAKYLLLFYSVAITCLLYLAVPDTVVIYIFNTIYRVLQLFSASLSKIENTSSASYSSVDP
ncbi:hypothetical protein NEMIN01_0339 [Nematocida minor]|uniref:uncharacterized protein n=1 Tax=Nematocida minor TaxID=1912983 RepID=UPI00221FA13E|nr:uncharacterized protein NEMIN01_0339 [Nematocida minor]KAI5189173.1 hypothetical protein NEMIN01_0339 [Nematocida minor]